MKRSKKKDYVQSVTKVASKKKEVKTNDSEFIKQMESIFSKEKYLFLLFFSICFLMCFLVFKDFLLAKKLFFFKDIGSDTVNVDYPWLKLREQMKTGYWNSWSFYVGMGYPYVDGIQISIEYYVISFFIFIGNLIYGNDAVYVRSFEIFWQIILIGCLFYAYLRTMKVSGYASIIGALVFTFLGFTIMGSSWGYQRNVLFAVMLLFSFEQLYKHNRWYFFPFAVIFMSDLYYCYLFGVFLLIYSLLRFYENEELKLKQYSILMTKVLFAGLLGFLMNIVLALPSLMLIFNSPRVTGNVTYFKAAENDVLNGLSGFEKITGILRTFSTDMMGNGATFKGWYNYLEAPLFYCGLFTLLIFTQILFFGSKKSRILYSAFALLWLLVAFVSPLRFALLMYAGNYYKIGINIFVSFMFVYLAVKSLDYIDKESKVNTIVLFGTLLVLLIALFYPYKFQNLNPVDKSLRNLAGFFLLAYSLLIFMIKYPSTRSFSKAGILFLCVIELLLFSSKTINSRKAYTSKEYKAEQFGYKDSTVDAINLIKTEDKNFYRVEKDYSSGNSMHGSLNDAMAQGYYSTVFYSSFNQKYYIRFLEETGIITKGEETQTRWAPGLRSRPLLQTIASVKYNLSKAEKPFMLNAGYSLQSKFGNVSLLKNEYSLPLGFAYDSCISIVEFQKLSNLQKDIALLRSFVKEENSAFNQSFPELSSKDTVTGFNFDYYKKFTSILRIDTLSITSFRQNEIKGTINLSKNKMLFFSIPYDKGWNATVDGKLVKVQLVNIGFCGIELEKGSHQISLKYLPVYYEESEFVSGIACFIFLIIFALHIYRNFKTKAKIRE